ncbi:DUF6197 family protein [Streptomyces sp. NPDC087294]|uniref:DUF6197 family protein n=1 Tax=Streptomyces sp. NPDC087294 TaxID=3365777 RepID=UPI0038278DFE
MPTRHTPENIVIPDTPATILEWAARPIEHVGTHQGLLEVAAGRGRAAAGGTYGWDRIDRARDQALGILAKTLTGHAADADEFAAAKALRHEVIDRWSAEPGRTAAACTDHSLS